MNGAHLSDLSTSDECLALRKVLTLLDFDVPKVIEFVRSSPEPMWLQLVFGCLQIQLDESQAQQHGKLQPATLAAVQEMLTHLRKPSAAPF